MVKAVIFDVDGVLLDSLDANHAFFTHLFEKTGYHTPTKAEYKKIIHMSLWDVIKLVTKLESEDEIRRIWEIAKNREGLPSTDHLMKIPDGLHEVISILHQTYTLGIVTSRVKDRIYSFPEMEGLRKYFDVTIAYEDTTNHKPHPEPLLLICDKLSLKPQEAIYIGDTASDMLAAKAAGMKGIIYGEKDHEQADAWTDTFKEIPKLVMRLH